MKFFLKHGTFEATLNICMRAWRNAHLFINKIHEGKAYDADVALDLIMSYAYESYASEFYYNGKATDLSKCEFDDILELPLKPGESSNIHEMIEALRDSIESTLSKVDGGDDDKKKVTEAPPE